MVEIRFDTSVHEKAENLTINIINKELALALSEVSIYSSFEPKIEEHETVGCVVIIKSNLYTNIKLEKYVAFGIIRAAIEDFLVKKLKAVLPTEDVLLISKTAISTLKNKDTEIFIHFRDKVYLLNLFEDKLELLGNL